MFKYESGVHRVQRVPADRVAGPHPHLDRDGRGAARGRGRRGRDQPQRPAHRRLPLRRPRRPVGQHDRLGGAHHAPAHRPGRHLPGRAQPAPEQGAGDEDPARAAVRGRSASRPSRRPRRRGCRRSAPASAARRSAPTTSRRTASPTTASTSRCTTWRAVLAGDLSRFTEALVGRGHDASSWRQRRRDRPWREVLRRSTGYLRASTAARRRGWTPSCCWRTASGFRGSSSTRSTTARSTRTSWPPAGSWCAAAACASRWPTSSAAGASAARSGGRRAGAGAASRDRAAGRPLPGAAGGRRARRACSTSAPAPARSRWRSRPSARTPRWSPATSRQDALDVAAANAGAAGPRASSCTSPTCWRRCRATASPGRLEPALRVGAGAGRPRAGGAPSTSRGWPPWPAPDGLEVYRRLLPEAAGRLEDGGSLALECGSGQAACAGRRAGRGSATAQAGDRPRPGRASSGWCAAPWR